MPWGAPRWVNHIPAPWAWGLGAWLPQEPPPGLGLSLAAEKSPRCPLTHGWCPSGAAHGMEAGDWGGNPEL